MDDHYSFSLGERHNNLNVDLPKTALTELLSELNRKTVSESLWLYDEASLEILVQEESRTLFRIFSKATLDARDDDNAISYRISSASDSYILFFLDQISQHTDFRFFLRAYPSHILKRKIADLEDDLDVFSLLRIGFLRIYTVTVSCDTNTPLAKMSRYANAFLFQMAFNTDTAWVPQRALGVLSRPGRIDRMGRSRPTDIDPPRRIYNEDLTHHYLLAVSTDNPVVEYLSHYHVLEHFYGAVFDDDLISSIQDRLTQPAFSYRRKRDIKGLISAIRKSMKIRNDTIAFSEEDALRLTLTRYVDLNGLMNDLDTYDAATIDYYRDNEVPFSGGSKVDLRSADSSDIMRKLAKRIYQTRNALVHSKDGDKAKYTPFVDDHSLSKEVPLLRFVAESTIVKDSTLIE